MKRRTRKTFAILIGLMLGWFAVGLLDMGSVDRFALANETPTTPQVQEPIDSTDESNDISTRSHGGDNDHQDAGQIAAGYLVPEKSDAAYFSTVLWIILALFILAVLIGVVVHKMGHADPGAQAIVEDHADHDHGHDHDAHSAVGHH